MALSLLTMLLGARAFAECKWTVQSTDKRFTEDQVLREKPQIQKSACSENGTPICVGYVYCTTADPAKPQDGAVACKAIKVADKWKCPDGQTCYDDPDVSISKLPKYPDGTVYSAPTPAAGAVREGGL
jgi:hypothetical protein